MPSQDAIIFSSAYNSACITAFFSLDSVTDAINLNGICIGQGFSSFILYSAVTVFVDNCHGDVRCVIGSGS